MKKIVYLFLFAILILANSCKKQEETAYFKGGTNPILTAISNSGGAVIDLIPADSTKTALSVSWTNPEYMFNNGVSSLNVAYLLEIDTVGSNFSYAKRAQIGISQSTDIDLSGTNFNSYLTNLMGLDTSFSHQLEIRILAYIVTSGAGADTLFSNVLKFTAKPYYPPPLITPPASGNLYIVGDATPGGWPPFSNDPNIQKFTKITGTLYELTININANGEYKFVEIPGQWDKQWSIKTEPAAGAPETLSGKLFFNGGNGRAPSQGGSYKVTVDFQTGKYTFIKQ